MPAASGAPMRMSIPCVAVPISSRSISSVVESTVPLRVNDNGPKLIVRGGGFEDDGARAWAWIRVRLISGEDQVDERRETREHRVQRGIGLGGGVEQPVSQLARHRSRLLRRRNGEAVASGQVNAEADRTVAWELECHAIVTGEDRRRIKALSKECYVLTFFGERHTLRKCGKYHLCQRCGITRTHGLGHAIFRHQWDDRGVGAILQPEHHGERTVGGGVIGNAKVVTGGGRGRQRSGLVLRRWRFPVASAKPPGSKSGR